MVVGHRLSREPQVVIGAEGGQGALEGTPLAQQAAGAGVLEGYVQMRQSGGRPLFHVKRLPAVRRARFVLRVQRIVDADQQPVHQIPSSLLDLAAERALGLEVVCKSHGGEQDGLRRLSPAWGRELPELRAHDARQTVELLLRGRAHDSDTLAPNTNLDRAAFHRHLIP
jgi:hypothetical protein